MGLNKHNANQAKASQIRQGFIIQDRFTGEYFQESTMRESGLMGLKWTKDYNQAHAFPTYASALASEAFNHPLIPQVQVRKLDPFTGNPEPDLEDEYGFAQDEGAP